MKRNRTKNNEVTITRTRTKKKRTRNNETQKPKRVRNKIPKRKRSRTKGLETFEQQCERLGVRIVPDKFSGKVNLTPIQEKLIQIRAFRKHGAHHYVKEAEKELAQLQDQERKSYVS